MIIHTVMGNRSHPEYGVASIPLRFLKTAFVINGKTKKFPSLLSPESLDTKAKTKSKPNEVGSIWKGKTTPSVNRAPSAAADDLMVLF